MQTDGLSRGEPLLRFAQTAASHAGSARTEKASNSSTALIAPHGHARPSIVIQHGQIADAAIFVTRTGRRVAAEGPKAFYAAERLQGALHPVIEESARPQFLIGRYELAVLRPCEL
jgi:hypothetical protein